MALHAVLDEAPERDAENRLADAQGLTLPLEHPPFRDALELSNEVAPLFAGSDAGNDNRTDPAYRSTEWKGPSKRILCSPLRVALRLQDRPNLIVIAELVKRQRGAGGGLQVGWRWHRRSTTK